jgi:hypothetical protein
MRAARTTLVALLLLAAACSDTQDVDLPQATSADGAADAQPVDLKRLPVGDDSLSDGPERGKLWPCRVETGGGGAQAEGPWFNDDGTWDSTKKITVDGSVRQDHELNITKSGEVRTIVGNGLPSHTTGTFPVSSTDNAYDYDRNPNRIQAQTDNIELPAEPEVAADPVCAPGEVGIMLTGVWLFNAIDAEGRDAVAHEVQDECGGHPQNTGRYHYHGPSDCLEDDGDGHSKLVGYAFDGFGIFGLRGEDGEDMTNADLDECHGHTHEISWDGEEMEMFHFHLTHEFPYSVGCLRAASAVQPGASGGGEQQQPPPPGDEPPAPGQRPPPPPSDRAPLPPGGRPPPP